MTIDLDVNNDRKSESVQSSGAIIKLYAIASCHINIR